MARRALLPLALALAACGGGGTPFPASVAYSEPRTAPVSCPAPTLVSGGVNPAPDPGATCVKAVRDSALPAVSASAPFGWVDLGEHTVGEVLSFAVPAGTASITLVEQVVSAADAVTFSFNGVPQGSTPNAAVVAVLRDPGGAVVYTDLTATGPPADGSSQLLFFDSQSPAVGTMTYPDSTAGLVAAAGGVAAGTWTAQVGDFAYECFLANGPNPPPGLVGIRCADDPAAGTATAYGAGRYRVSLLTRPAAASGAAIPATGALDVAFHLVDAPAPGVLPFTAASAPGSAVAQRLVEVYGGLLAGAGLCLGTVTFLDAPGWARTRFGSGISDADLSPCGEFSQLLTLSVPGQRTLDLFLVTDITGGTASTRTLGVDGTVPGPATVNGTIASGAMVSAADLGFGSCAGAGGAVDLARCGTDLTAYIAAHETGHFLGLYHVTEAAGTAWDPLSSTPRCQCSCAAGGCAGTLLAPSCQRSSSCGGGQNLMFWVIDPPSSRGYLTGEQGQVMRASPLVR